MTGPSSTRLKQLKVSSLPPTKVIIISNQKGGVGKTTITLNCAWMAVELDPRPALVIELCSQGNASSTLHGKSCDDVECLKTFDLLTKDNPAGLPLVCQDNVEVIPATRDMFDIESVEADELLPHFKANVERLAASDKYSWIFIDSPPSLGSFQLVGLSVADFALIPMRLDRFSMEGLDSLLDTISVVQDGVNPKLEILGVLPNMLNASRKEQIQALAAIVKELGDAVLETPIRDRGPIADSVDAGQAIWKNIRSGNARAAALELRKAIADILRRAR